MEGGIQHLKAAGEKTYPCSGVILAGGLASRFSGTEKALIQVGGKRIIESIYSLFRNLFGEILLVTNHPEIYLDWDLEIVTDMFPWRSSLTGLHAGLFHANSHHAFVTACDTPFLKKELIQFLLGQIDSRTDVVVPETANGVESLCAIYSKACLKPIEAHLNEGRLQIKQFYPKVRVKSIPEKRLRRLDPELLSFFNINTPQDLQQAKQRVEPGPESR
jgi:molybdopterin-guanine dinucleotide biosynthesis protein A